MTDDSAAAEPGADGVLGDDDRAIYAWQLDVPGFGEEGQAALRRSTALVSRVGGLGGPVALQLAAAGIGKLILAMGGNLKESDLNRQILMRHAWLGKSRVDCAKATLHDFNPNIEVETVAANINEDNAASVVAGADIVFDCAPMFEERFLMNRECVRQGKPLIDCAMYNTEGQVIPIVPGRTPCLRCLYPDVPPHWRRRFPVIGATSALIGMIGVMEGLKAIAGFGEPNAGKMIVVDASEMSVRKITIARRPNCPVCGHLTNDSEAV